MLVQLFDPGLKSAFLIILSILEPAILINLILKLLLVEVLQLLLPLVMSDLQLVHMLLIVVLLLGFSHLKDLVVTIELIQFLGLLFLHLIVTLDEGEVLCTKGGVHLVVLLLHLSAESLLLLPPIFHQTFANKHDAAQFILDFNLKF